MAMDTAAAADLIRRVNVPAGGGHRWWPARWRQFSMYAMAAGQQCTRCEEKVPPRAVAFLDNIGQ